jgi:hypothetical protein
MTRFVPARANKQPATAIYIRDPGDEGFRLLAFEVLRVEDGNSTEIVDYSDQSCSQRSAAAEALSRRCSGGGGRRDAGRPGPDESVALQGSQRCLSLPLGWVRSGA